MASAQVTPRTAVVTEYIWPVIISLVEDTGLSVDVSYSITDIVLRETNGDRVLVAPYYQSVDVDWFFASSVLPVLHTLYANGWRLEQVITHHNLFTLVKSTGSSISRP